jgi:hypothetical protein
MVNGIKNAGAWNNPVLYQRLEDMERKFHGVNEPKWVSKGKQL